MRKERKAWERAGEGGRGGRAGGPASKRSPRSSTKREMSVSSLCVRLCVMRVVLCVLCISTVLSGGLNIGILPEYPVCTLIMQAVRYETHGIILAVHTYIPSDIRHQTSDIDDGIARTPDMDIAPRPSKTSHIAHRTLHIHRHQTRPSHIHQ